MGTHIDTKKPQYAHHYCRINCPTSRFGKDQKTTYRRVSVKLNRDHDLTMENALRLPFSKLIHNTLQRVSFMFFLS